MQRKGKWITALRSAQQALTERIKQVRRRHYGPRGKAEFAEKLGLSPDEYQRFERGVIPPGDVMVRICETTGEDLQWLLTGVSARGTVVISGARGRHQDLLARIATLLDLKPGVAGPLDAFVGLLQEGEHVRLDAATATLPDPSELIPILEADELPDSWPNPDDDPGRFPLAAPPKDIESVIQTCPAGLTEAVECVEGAEPDVRSVSIVTLRTGTEHERRWVRSRELAKCFPGMLGVDISDDAMAPALSPGDTALVVPEVEARLGRPALCKFAGESAPRCRVWLGEQGGEVCLGRSHDGAEERMVSSALLWSVEVLYRVRSAA